MEPILIIDAPTLPYHCQEIAVPGPAGIILHARVWMHNALFHRGMEYAISAIVAIHGIYQASKCWDHQAALAAPDTILIAFDLPFHGETYTPSHVLLQSDLMAQSIHAIIEFFHLQETHCFLMGWSFGAWCIGSYLQRYGTNMIQGLIIVSGLLGDMNHCLSLVQDQQHDALNTMSILADPDATTVSVLAATQQFVALLRHKPSRWEEYAEEYSTELGYNVRAITRMRSSVVNPLAIVAQNTLDGLYAQLNQASIPVCLLTGTQDAILPVEWSRLIADQLTHVETFEQEQCGHSFFAEYPEKFNTAVRVFLQNCLPKE